MAFVKCINKLLVTLNSLGASNWDPIMFEMYAQNVPCVIEVCVSRTQAAVVCRWMVLC